MHGHVRAPRRFVYWREEPLRAVVERGRLAGATTSCTGWAATARRGSPITGRAILSAVRHTEFWSRMEDALGPAYHRAWASQFVMAELGGRTAQEALDAGVPPKQVWAAVWRALDLPGVRRDASPTSPSSAAPASTPSSRTPRSTPSPRRTATRPRRSRSAPWPGGGWRSCRGTGSTTTSRRTAINYRANLWALRSLGVRQVLAPCAVGGLSPEVAPGDLVVPDQLVDRTTAAARRTSSAARCTCRSPIPTARASPTPWPPPPRTSPRRDDGGDRRAAVLDARRVAVVRRPGRHADQHDRRARGGARPGAADVLLRAGAGDGHGRRRRGRRASARPRSSRGSGRTSSGSPRCWAPRSPLCPTRTAAPARPGPTASS